MTRVDVVVVGAGPAGSVAAREMARRGASVLLVDRQPFPRPKVCGGCIGPAAMHLLDTIGLRADVMAAGARPSTQLRLTCGERDARIALSGGAVLSRTRLDGLLSEAAAVEGVRFRDGAKASIVRNSPDDIAVRIVTAEGTSIVSAAVVLDATGLGSGVPGPEVRDPSRDGGLASADARARSADTMPRAGPGSRVAPASRIASGSRIAPGSGVAPGSRVGLGTTVEGDESWVRAGQIRMVVGSVGYVGLARLECGGVNVAAAVDRAELAALGPDRVVGKILGESSGLGSAWENARASGTDGGEKRWRGTPALTRRPAARADVRLFRIGDAAGYVEPFTGEGMGWAIASALAVVPIVEAAVRRWDDRLIDEWERSYRRRVGGGQRMCRIISAALRHPSLVRPAVALLERRPALASPFVRATDRIARS